MAKATASMGGSIGGLLGMLIAAAIPVGESSFFVRLTGNVPLSTDPVGFAISGGYLLLGLVVGGVIGALVGNMAG